jgi:N-carbamoylputrescine amidase
MDRIAAVQVSASGDVERNRKKAVRYLEAAAERGAGLVCFPELFGTPWFLSAAVPDPGPHAEDVDGPLLTLLAEHCRRLGVAAVCPFAERLADGAVANSAAVIDRAGVLQGVYRKVHLPELEGWREKTAFHPGDAGFPVFELGGLRVGIQLGWDLFFPEGFRALAVAGAQVVLVPSAAAYASQERWLAMAVSHAVANGMYVVRVNRVGSEAGLDFYGHTFAVRPDGELSAPPIELGEGLLLADCDPQEVAEARRTWPFLTDRRPGQYASLAVGPAPAADQTPGTGGSVP